jgi:hypothetical protein
MTVNYHSPESRGARYGRHRRPEDTAGFSDTRQDQSFCDFHLFRRRYGEPPRIVVVHREPTSGHTVPVVTWLEVRCTGDAAGAAAVVLEVLGQAAAEASVPVRLYDHDPHGNIHSWAPHRPTELTRERLTAVAVGRVER